MVKSKKIGIIGAGIAGLSAGLRLASLGHKVDIFEKNDFPGGKINSIKGNGFRFDFGPSLITMPFILEELFSFCNLNFKEYIKLTKLNTTCRYFFNDGTTFDAYSDYNNLINEINNKFKVDRNSFKKYFKYIEKIYNLTSDFFLFHSLLDIKNWLSIYSLRALLNFKDIDMSRTMNQSNTKYFQDSKLVQYLNRYATYNGSNPYLAPATLNIIPYVEMKFGAYVPEGGIVSIANSLYNAGKDLGINFYFNEDVQKIILNNGKVKGLLSNNEYRDYDLIISNSDVYFTYEKLLNMKLPYRILKSEPSTSAVIFYFGLNNFKSDLSIHNILFSSDYKKEFYELYKENKIPEDPTIYIYISSKYNPDDAPKDSENWYIMINAPYNSGQEWQNDIQKTKLTLLEKINNMLKYDIKEHISFEKVIIPTDIENITRSKFGSIYGISSNSKYSAFLRHQNKNRKIRGLYFCGGSYHPGGGIPLALLSGKITSDLITADYSE